MTATTTHTATDRPTVDDAAPVDTTAPADPTVDIVATLSAAADVDAATLADAIDAAYRVHTMSVRSTVARDMDAMAAVIAHRDDAAVAAAWSRFTTAPDYVDPFAAVIADVAVLYAAQLDRLSTVDAANMDRVIADAMAMGEYADPAAVQRAVTATRPLSTTVRSSGARSHIDRDYTAVVGQTFYGSGSRSGYTMTVDAADPSGYPGVYIVRDATGADVGTYASPTAAAVAVTGCSTRGPLFWRTVPRGTAGHDITLSDAAAIR